MVAAQIYSQLMQHQQYAHVPRTVERDRGAGESIMRA